MPKAKPFDPGNPPNRLRELRERAGLTQPAVARAIGASSAQQIYKLEKLLNPLTHGWMVVLGKALDVRPAAFIDPTIEVLSAAERGGQRPEEVERRFLILDVWDTLNREQQDILLLNAREFVRGRAGES